MYVVLEYQDYRKENYIHVHGVTNDLEKAKQRALDILKTHMSEETDSNFYQIYDCSKDQKSYVALQQKVKYEFSIREITLDSVKLLGKTVGELFEMLDEPVPKRLRADKNTVITKQLFREMIDNQTITEGCMNFLQSDCQCIDICQYSAIAAVAQVDEI